MGILDITSMPFKDDSIENYEYHEYLPGILDRDYLNNPGKDITIDINARDIFTHPSESYLIIEGKLVKEDNSEYKNEDNIALTNNGLMYLFSIIRYKPSDKEIESITHPGWATTILGLLKYDNNFTKSRGLNQLWYKDTDKEINDDNVGWKVRKNFVINDITSDGLVPGKKGSFRFKIPLKHIFGFCEDYDKVLYGIKHTLCLTRAEDNDAIFKSDAADGKIVLEKISWYMPQVMPNDEHKMRLCKRILDKETFPVNYRMIQCESSTVPPSTSFNWRLSVKTAPDIPRFIIIGFQTGKENNQNQNPALFDHVFVENICVNLNSYNYPITAYALSFENNKFCRAYGDAAAFRSKFFLTDDLTSNPNFNPLEYKNLYPLFVFDISKRSERLKYYTIDDIIVHADFRVNVPEKTRAYAVVLSDARLISQFDGSKMIVTY